MRQVPQNLDPPLLLLVTISKYKLGHPSYLQDKNPSLLA